MKRHIILLTIAVAASLLSACRGRNITESEEYPPIFPDYTEVTVPEGMAKLTFVMADGRKFRESREFRDGAEWITVTAWSEGENNAVRYKPFPVYISKDEIDPYLVYRLIEPGYESWKYISINCRELASFKEKEIVNNRANGNGCINCHTFNGGSPSGMLFHARGKGGGTVFIDKGRARILNLATTGPKMQGTYPAWHPDGRYLAFSSNNTRQVFTVDNVQPIEVYDTSSDIILMDLENDSIVLPPVLSGEGQLETFPSWSEDGRTLYFCCADSPGDIVTNREKVHYRLMAIDFNDGEFAGEPRVVWEDPHGSASFPREKNGRILFTRSDFGTFPIWHSEADLWVLDLATGCASPATALNSDSTESYHSFSSNGKWVVFSSRRIDNRYTRLYIAHCNEDGTFDKPFLLPQRNPLYNTLRLKSYNIPEFAVADVPCYQKEISKLFK